MSNPPKRGLATREFVVFLSVIDYLNKSIGSADRKVRSTIEARPAGELPSAALTVRMAFVSLYASFC